MNRLTPYFRGSYRSIEDVRRHADDVLGFCVAMERIEREGHGGSECSFELAEMADWALNMLLHSGPHSAESGRTMPKQDR